MHQHESEGTQILEKTKLKKMEKYNVIMLNDDFTPMEFVMLVLEKIFSKTSEEAYQITLAIHNTGKSIVGTYTKEIAEVKVSTCLYNAQNNDFPLQVVIEPVQE
jgi:ATP-dependent Clp protease adaptor protein ClpS